MSADNWGICPRCFNEAKDSADETRAAFSLVQAPNSERFRTFREDYEFFGVESGTLEFYYAGACTECGLRVEFQDSKKFWEPTQDA